MSKLTDAVREYVNAAFSGIYIHTQEPDDALAELTGLCQKEKWVWATWDVASGMKVMGQGAGDEDSEGDPVAAVKALSRLASGKADSAGILIMRNLHLFTGGDGKSVLVQALETALKEGKHNRTFVVALSPVIEIPIELQRGFVVVEHELPDRAEMEKVLRGIATEPGDLPPDITPILDASIGLTRGEAENAFTLALIRNGQVYARPVWELKAAALKKSGILTLHEGTEDFGSIGGLDNLKTFCKKALTSKNTKARPRGVLLLGPPGTGKSAFAKALGTEVERPTITLDIGSLMGSLVGETESNTRRALAIIDAMAPCIVFVDELEKALSGVQGGGGDNGVSERMFGTLLSWLSDHRTDVAFVGTTNNISLLPPEFSRAERFDGIFFIDLPGDGQKKIIWDMYMKNYELDSQRRPADKDWTGAEIKSCCRLAAMLGVSLIEAAQYIVPVAVTSGESVERLRTWATGRCISAEKPGIYSHDIAVEIKGGRNIKRSAN